MRITLLALFGCVALSAICLFVINSSRNAETVTRALALIDDPVLLDMDGKPFDVAANFPDGILVVIFTRTDCPIANRYAPEIRRLWEEFQPQGVVFWLVYVDSPNSLEVVQKHLAEYKYPCPAYLDPDHNLAFLTGATVTPEAVVHDRTHKIVYRGRIDDLFVDLGMSRTDAASHDLEDAISATLQDRPVEMPETEAIGCYIEYLK